MKRILVLFLILILFSCTTKKYDINDFYFDDVINGQVDITYKISLDEDIIPFNYSYLFNKNGNMAYINVKENNIAMEIEMMDDLSFVIIDDVKYSYDEANVLLANILPITFSIDDIVNCQKSDNIYIYELTKEKISSLMGISEDSIISNEFRYEIIDEHIVSEDITIVYADDESETTFTKYATYGYEPQELTFTSFDYLDEDFSQFSGSCRFDYGASNIVTNIEIVDNDIISLGIVQNSSLDTISSFHEDIDEYVKQLNDLYAALNGVSTSIKLSDDSLTISHNIDMDNIDDRTLSILDLKTNGHEYVQYLRSKGYVCE